MLRIIPVKPDNPDIDAVKAAVEAMLKGEMIIYPTETFYGLGVDCNNIKAVTRLYNHKKRDSDKPVPVIIPDISMVERYASHISNDAGRLMEEFWPGPLTLVFPAISDVLPLIMGNTNTIGMRAPGCAVSRELAKELDGAVTATSANYAGGKSCSRIWDIPEKLRKATGLMLHGGDTPGLEPSTVISVCEKQPVLIREGALPKKDIEKCLGFEISNRQ